LLPDVENRPRRACRRVRRRLAADETDEKDELHLRACEQCAAYARALRCVDELLDRYLQRNHPCPPVR